MREPADLVAHDFAGRWRRRLATVAAMNTNEAVSARSTRRSLQDSRADRTDDQSLSVPSSELRVETE